MALRRQFGDQAVEGFYKDGLVVNHVIRDPDAPSGVALIFVEESGENSIAVVFVHDAALVAARVGRPEPALTRAVQILESSRAAVRHIVLLSDGEDSVQGYDFDFGTFQRTFAESKITCTAIGIGEYAPDLLVRVQTPGAGGPYFITGDATQIDLPRGVSSGLHDAERLLKSIDRISFNYFTAKDVVRHPLVAAIIEDHPEVALLLRETLSMADIESSHAMTLAQGRKLIEKGRPELVLVDLILPDGNGMELVKELRESDFRISVESS